MTDVLDNFWRGENSARVGAKGFVIEPDLIANGHVDGELPVDVFVAAEADPDTDRQTVVVRVTTADLDAARGVLVAIVDHDGAYHEAFVGRLGRVVFPSIATGPARCAVGGELAVERSDDPLVVQVATIRINTLFDKLTSSLGDIDDALAALLDDRAVDMTDAVLSRSEFSEPEFVHFGGATPRVQRFPIQVSSELAGLGDVADATVTWRDRDRLVSIYCRRALPEVRVFVVLSSTEHRSVAVGSVMGGHEIVAAVAWPYPEPPTELRVAVVSV